MKNKKRSAQELKRRSIASRKKPPLKAWQESCAYLRKQKWPLLAIRIKDLCCLDTEGLLSAVDRNEYLGMRWQEFVDPFRLEDLIKWLRDKTKNQQEGVDDDGFYFYAAITRAGKQQMAKIWLSKLTFDGVAVCVGNIDKILEKPLVSA